VAVSKADKCCEFGASVLSAPRPPMAINRESYYSEGIFRENNLKGDACKKYLTLLNLLCAFIYAKHDCRVLSVSIKHVNIAYSIAINAVLHRITSKWSKNFPSPKEWTDESS